MYLVSSEPVDGPLQLVLRAVASGADPFAHCAPRACPLAGLHGLILGLLARRRSFCAPGRHALALVLRHGERAAVMVREAGAVIIVPMAMIAEDAHDDACVAASPPAMLE